MPEVTLAKFPLSCIAPPLTDELLAKYTQLADFSPASPPPFLADWAEEKLVELKDACQQLLACIRVWWELPESQRPGTNWTVLDKRTDTERSVHLRPLEHGHIERLFDVTPWPREVQSMAGLFAELPHGQEERPVVVPYKSETKEGVIRKTQMFVVDQAAFDFHTMAHHLLWHGLEISADREPFTQDKYHV